MLIFLTQLLPDERIIEYDIDTLVYEARSPFQKIQIMHSKTLGNMLILDELQSKLGHMPVKWGQGRRPRDLHRPS